MPLLQKERYCCVPGHQGAHTNKVQALWAGSRFRCSQHEEARKINLLFPGRGPVKKNKHMDCAMEPLNGAVFLSRMKTEVFCKAFVSTVLGRDSHRHAAPFFIPVLSAPGWRKGLYHEF